MRCIVAVKQFGKTKYGALTQEEFDKLIKEHPFFFKVDHYIEKSFIMGGDYKRAKVYSTDLEAHVFSKSMLNPRAPDFRFREKKTHKHMRFSKK